MQKKSGNSTDTWLILHPKPFLRVQWSWIVQRSLWISGIEKLHPGFLTWRSQMKQLLFVDQRTDGESKPRQGWPSPGLPRSHPRGSWWHQEHPGLPWTRCWAHKSAKTLHWAVGWQNPAQMDVQGRVGSRNQHSSSAWHEFSSAEELNGFRLRLISLSWSKTEAGLLEFLLLPCHYTAESQELSKDMNNICPYLIQPAADNCLSPFPSVHELHQRPWSHHTEFRQICSCRATLQIRTSLCLKWRKREEIAASTKKKTKKKLPR